MTLHFQSFFLFEAGVFISLCKKLGWTGWSPRTWPQWSITTISVLCHASNTSRTWDLLSLSRLLSPDLLSWKGHCGTFHVNSAIETVAAMRLGRWDSGLFFCSLQSKVASNPAVPRLRPHGWPQGAMELFMLNCQDGNAISTPWLNGLSRDFKRTFKWTSNQPSPTLSPFKSVLSPGRPFDKSHVWSYPKKPNWPWRGSAALVQAGLAPVWAESLELPSGFLADHSKPKGESWEKTWKNTLENTNLWDLRIAPRRCRFNWHCLARVPSVINGTRNPVAQSLAPSMMSSRYGLRL